MFPIPHECILIRQSMEHVEFLKANALIGKDVHLFLVGGAVAERVFRGQMKSMGHPIDGSYDDIDMKISAPVG